MAVDDKVSNSFAAGNEQDAIACATPADAIAGDMAAKIRVCSAVERRALQEGERV